MAYNVVFPQGARTIFTQEFAPVGWTKLTQFGTMDVQGAAIRISSNNVVNYRNGVPFETVFSNANLRTVLNGDSATVTINAPLSSTALSEIQMPTHTHLRRLTGPMSSPAFGVVGQPIASRPPATDNYFYSEPVKQVARIYGNPHPGTMVPYFDQTNLAIRYSNDLTDAYTNFAGSNVPNITKWYETVGPGGSHNHTMSATLTALPAPINFAIKYVDCVIASKD